MKPILHFLENPIEIFDDENVCMRHRILAATLPCTCRSYNRKPFRIPSKHRKGCGLKFMIRMACGISEKNRPSHGFLLVFELNESRSIA